MINNDIERMLENGSTPESIYQEALRIVEAKNAAKAKMKKNIDDARDNAIKAFLKYVETLTGEKVSVSEVERLKRGFAEIEKELESMVGLKTEPFKPLKNDKQKEQDAIQKFLKDIGAL